MKAYLCGPINGCTDAECKDWRAKFVAPKDARISPWLRYHSHRIVHSYEDAAKAAQEVLR